MTYRNESLQYTRSDIYFNLLNDCMY